MLKIVFSQRDSNIKFFFYMLCIYILIHVLCEAPLSTLFSGYGVLLHRCNVYSNFFPAASLPMYRLLNQNTIRSTSA